MGPRLRGDDAKAVSTFGGWYETIIGSIKAFSSLNLPKHRLPINGFLHIMAAVTAYQLDPIKPVETTYLEKLSLPMEP